jgi:SAM-dependent methyltransferase
MSSILDYYKEGKSGKDKAPETEERIMIVRDWADRLKGNILDVGCSDGRLASLLRGPSRKVVGVELDPGRTAEASARLDDVMSFDVSSRWPLVPGDVSAVHLGAVIEHIFDYNTLFDEVARILEKDGFLWISVPNMACLRHRFEVMTGTMPSWYRNYEHIRMWTLGWLDRSIIPRGFVRTRLKGAHGQGSRNTLIHRFIAKHFPTLSSILVVEYRKV